MPITIYPATAPQVRFVNDLRRERGLAELTRDEAATLTGRDASREIDRLKALPRVAPAPRAGGLADLPLSKYSLVEGNVRTFWEVKEYRGTRYLRMLVGAPGEFTRVRVGFARATTVAAAIRENPLAAAQAFGAYYTVCSVCCADLSDPVSVALKIGPVCRRRFGL